MGKGRREIGSGLSPTLLHKSQGELSQHKGRSYNTSYKLTGSISKSRSNGHPIIILQASRRCFAPICTTYWEAGRGLSCLCRNFRGGHVGKVIPGKPRCWYCPVNNLLAMNEKTTCNLVKLICLLSILLWFLSAWQPSILCPCTWLKIYPNLRFTYMRICIKKKHVIKVYKIIQIKAQS